MRSSTDSDPWPQARQGSVSIGPSLGINPSKLMKSMVIDYFLKSRRSLYSTTPSFVCYRIQGPFMIQSGPNYVQHLVTSNSGKP